MSADLKACPLCGGAAAMVALAWAQFGVRCVSDTHFIHTYGATAEEAAAAWNIRPQPDALSREEIALDAVMALREAFHDTTSALLTNAHAQEIIAALKARGSRLSRLPASRAGAPEGWALVPLGPTRDMLNAAVDVDSFKLGDIAPLGFRCSPQMLFEQCWAAMLSAAPAAPHTQDSSEGKS